MLRRKAFMTAAAAILVAGLIASSAEAKCDHACKMSIQAAFHSCKAACAHGKAGKTCRSDCAAAKKTAKQNCRTATPPKCSPSGSFIDPSL